MLDQDILSRLDELETFVGKYGSEDLDATDFWDGFHAIAGPIETAAFADDADPELRERYTAILAVADERGFMVPPTASS